LTEQIASAARRTAAAEDIDAARRDFDELSKAVLQLVETFGNSLPDSIYQIHCPMAFANRGADWLQSGQEVANPYFGAKMFRCGEIRRTFAPVDGPQVKEDQP